VRIWIGPLIGSAFGCATAPSFSLPEQRLLVSTDHGVRVLGSNFELDFAATGVHMPEHLLVNHVDVLGVDDSCRGENRIGIAVSPAVQASAGVASDSNPEPLVLAAGPLIAKVQVHYALDYTCPKKERLSGISEFTIFASGRIARWDSQVQPSNNSLVRFGECGCQHETDSANFRDLFFASFWAFDPVGANQVQADGNPVTDDVLAACTLYTDHAIAVAWQNPPPAESHTRFHSQRTASHSLDWPTSDHHMILPTQQSVTSEIQITAAAPQSKNTCAASLANLAKAPLRIGSLSLNTDNDGVYRDPTVHTAAFDIVAGTAAVPPGFAISVDLGGADHAVIKDQNDTEHIAIAQREEGSRFFIIFNDVLMPGDSLTIEPRS